MATLCFCHNLVVRVLKHHAHPAANLQQEALVGGVHAVHIYLPAPRQEDGVHVLGERGLAAAVVAQDDHKAALPDGHADAVQGVDRRLALLGGIGEGEILCSYDIAHRVSSLRGFT